MTPAANQTTTVRSRKPVEIALALIHVWKEILVHQQRNVQLKTTERLARAQQDLLAIHL